MAGTGAGTLAVGLVGRERESEAIDQVLARAHRGEGRALVLRGEAGMGKSALLDQAATRAEGFLVLHATGVEAESDLAFAGLFSLVRPIVHKLDELPVVQRAALAGALGLAPASAADRLLVSAAVLSLLAAAAEDQPLLCIVDDAQWLDRPSADALVFTARRVRAEQLALLFAAREGESQRFEAVGLPELYLEGLDPDSARLLVLRSKGEAAVSVRERLVTDAAGNPLALLELPAALSEEQLAGIEALPDAIPLTPRLRGVFRQRIDRLPEEAQRALRIAAAEDTGDTATVMRALVQAQLPTSAFDAAERSDLIRVDGGMITFRHPLVRSALTVAGTLHERRLAHMALANALTGEENTDRRVWHQAMATLDPDEEVAAALEASARRAQARAAHSSAATALLRAAELSTDGERRARRIAAAAQAALDAGQPDRARDAIARALPLADEELKATLLFLRGVIEFRCGNLSEALPQLLEAAELTDHPIRRLEILTEAGQLAAWLGRRQTMIELGERAEPLSPTTAGERLRHAGLTGFAYLYLHRFEEARARLETAMREGEGVESPRELVFAAIAASAAHDVGAGLPYVNRAVETARRRGLVADLAGALEWQALELNLTGSFDRARAAAEEGYRLSLDLGRGSAWQLTCLGMAEAGLGRVDEARRHVEQATAVGQQTGSGNLLLTGYAQWTLALIDLETGRPQEALDRLLALTSLENEAHLTVALRATPDTIEAAARCGRTDALGERYAMFEAYAQGAPTPQRRALLARCQALLAHRPPGDAFEEALLQQHVLNPMERARTELLYGEWLRRERRRQEARVHLRAALDLFRGLGMRLFAERAEAELRASGETARKRDPSTLDDLTPQELQIAGLVAEGQTNKEIGAQLFISPRTVDYHLRKVFSKLGISSRTQLVRDGLPKRG